MKRYSYKKIKTLRSWFKLNLKYLQSISRDNFEVPRQIGRKTAQTTGVRYEDGS